MKGISSTEFRVSYQRLTEPVAVSQYGHEIGVWLPAGTRVDSTFAAPGEPRQMKPKVVEEQPMPEPQPSPVVRSFSKSRQAGR